MPITKSAEKAVRTAARKRVYNLRRSRAVASVESEIAKLVAAGKAADAQAKLAQAYKAIDKATKMGTLKANTASRKKSRLSAIIKRAKAAK